MTDTPLSTGVGLTASAAGWTNRFHSLGPAFFTDLSAQPLPDPHWVARSSECARDLGLTADWWQDPVALWAGQLGDGRTLWLGELETPGGAMELQLKDAGITLHSRMGDGRAVLRSSIREFLRSEAMHALGIPTTRALCITGSPLPVRHEETKTASVVTRIAPSFIRFGHFEHFSHTDQHAEPKRLADFVIAHHHPACADNANPDAALLATVAERTAGLLAQWQAVGFCHGVMNTDNMPILGLTIDCGPFGFLDAFDPGHICNHSDHQSRYAFARQPNVAFWDLHALVQALLPLIGDSDEALAALELYKTAFPQAFVARMPARLGLRDLFIDREAFDAWAARYRARLAGEASVDAVRASAMNAVNPKYLLRNHLADVAIQQARSGDFSEVQRLAELLQRPFDEQPERSAYADFPPDWAQHLEVSCSS